jgi:hypothetical protein
MGHLVPRVEDRRKRLRVAVGRQARDEGRRQAVLLEQAEDARPPTSGPNAWCVITIACSE